VNLDLAKARQQEIRAHLLRALDRQRPASTAEAIILRSLQQSGLTVKREALVQELSYLEGKELARHTERLWSLLPLGVDVLEHNVPDLPGIPINGALSPEARAYRQEVRGRLLSALYFARPQGASAGLLWRALDDSDLSVSGRELAREAAYLAGKGLLSISGDVTGDGWGAVLTATGQDVVEGSTPTPPGVYLIEWEV